MIYEEALMGLVILLNSDRRMFYCSYYKVKSKFVHNENNCPRCVALSILNDKDGTFRTKGSM